MNKQQLAARIWESANQMRSKIEANEYKDYILGFIFYKYLSDKLEQFAKAQGFTREDIRALTEDDSATVEFLQNNLGYFIAYENLISSELLSENGDAWRNAAVAKEAKNLRADAKASGAYSEESIETQIIQLAAWLDEEKKLKKAVQDSEEALHLATKSTLENLSAEQVRELLQAKWIEPLIAAFDKTPDNIIADLASRVQVLADKYATTYAEVAGQIVETKSSLSSLIDGLTGNEYDMKGLREFQSLLQYGAGDGTSALSPLSSKVPGKPKKMGEVNDSRIY